MKERLKELRAALGVGQIEFSKRINVAQSTYAQFETGRREPRNIHISQICTTFNVNEHWLRTGEGDMFVKTSDSMMENFCTKYNLDSISRSILEIFIELPPEYRHAILDAARKLVQRTSSKEELDIDADIKATKSDTDSQHQNETRA